MWRLVIILLVFPLAREYPNVSSMVTSKLSNSNAWAHKSQNRVGVAGREDGAPQIVMVSEDAEFKASGQNDNMERSGLTGLISRWFRSKRDKKKIMEQEGKCCIRYGTPISGRNYKTLKFPGNGSNKCCAHVKAVGHDGYPNLGTGEKAEIMVGGAAKDSKISLHRSTYTGSESTSGLAPKSGSSVVAGTVERYGGLPHWERTYVRQPSSPTGGHTCICELCCEQYCPPAVKDCCGNCIIISIGCPVWAIHRGLGACCGLLYKGLKVCFKPCCS